MNFTALVVIIIVCAIVAVVCFGLYELTPFAHHTNPYREPRSGKRLWDSPHLETRGEFEQRTHDGVDER